MDFRSFAGLVKLKRIFDKHSLVASGYLGDSEFSSMMDDASLDPYFVEKIVKNIEIESQHDEHSHSHGKFHEDDFLL